MAPVPGDSSKTPAWHIDAARGPSTPSLDHLLGAGKQYLRDHETEALRRPEIDHKLEFRRCLHRKIRRLGAAENAAHILRCAPELVPIGVNCRNAKLCGERDD